MCVSGKPRRPDKEALIVVLIGNHNSGPKPGIAHTLSIIILMSLAVCRAIPGLASEDINLITWTHLCDAVSMAELIG